uniref:Secreted protein n=1 Tax=Ixodes scapularis TaxID=6945 RepID=A0A4D5RWQ1_IXOSC
MHLLLVFHLWYTVTCICLVHQGTPFVLLVFAKLVILVVRVFAKAVCRFSCECTHFGPYKLAWSHKYYPHQ